MNYSSGKSNMKILSHKMKGKVIHYANPLPFSLTSTFLLLSRLQNKEYIYRGQQFERLSDFQARIQNQYPAAKIMEKLLPPNR